MNFSYSKTEKGRERERKTKTLQQYFTILKRLFRFRCFLNDGRLKVVRLFFLEKETLNLICAE